MKLNGSVKNRAREREQGQTLVIAVIILAVLLILGLGFATLLNQNIRNTATSVDRTQSDDLASAGVEYAHAQLVNSISGGDWRPEPTALSGVGDDTKDPDAYYLRPASGLNVTVTQGATTFTMVDRGGPDFLGPYSRVNFQRGRVLIRVRYTPAQYEALTGQIATSLSPGALRRSLIIESVGRSGAVDGEKEDPTRQLSTSVQYRNFADEAALRAGVGQMAQVDRQVGESRKLIGVASLGLIEFARSIWNTANETKEAEIGFPVAGSGGSWFEQAKPNVQYEGVDVAVPVSMGETAGGAGTVPGMSNNWSLIPGGASLFSNASLVIHGRVNLALNKALGESVQVNGSIRPANSSSSVVLTQSTYNKANDQFVNTTTTLASTDLESNDPNFSTQSGLIRTSKAESDQAGYANGVTRREPPSFFSRDPQTNVNRYEAVSRLSGALNANGDNIGEWGYGEGIFINSSERANRTSTDQRLKSDPAKSLPNDWLNPNNSNSRGWQGPFYIPLAASIELLPDGFRITRDSRSANPYWRDPASGLELTNRTAVRYYTRRYTGTDATKYGKSFIVDDVQNPTFDPLIDQEAFIATAGVREFSGVILAAGDVRVRGVIPTDIQVTVVSNGTIYVDGSITKGVVERNATSGAPTVLTRPSLSMALLAARDYVTLNTTQIFGTASGQSPQSKVTENLPDTPSPVELDATKNSLTLTAQFLLNPDTSNDPSAWNPFASTYRTPAGLLTSQVNITSNLLFMAAADDDGPTFASLKVEPMSFGQTTVGPMSYLFPGRYNFNQGSTLYTEEVNDASPFFPTPAPPAAPLPWNIPLIGMADGGLNTYPRFQTVATPIYNTGDPSYWQAYNFTDRLLKPALDVSNVPLNPEGGYHLAMQDPTNFEIRLDSVVGQPSKNFLLGRAAIAPFDVRIEATIYAEEGSFFVIPGHWFNSNPSDTRAEFEDDLVNKYGGSIASVDYGASTALADAQRERYLTFGNSPEVPFYGEPLDVRITIVGALAENMPAPMSQQTEWLRKWGWIPRRIGGSGLPIPEQHAGGTNLAPTGSVAPNLVIIHDPVLASAAQPSNPTLAVRSDLNGNVLPPLPRLPVSPTLIYFGEENP